MKKYVSLAVAFLMFFIFPPQASGNFLSSGTSGTIADTSLQYTDLDFSRRIVSVKIINTGLAVNFMAVVRVVDSQGKVMMQSREPLRGIIPASGSALLSSTYPAIRAIPRAGSFHQVQWLNISVVPVVPQTPVVPKASQAPFLTTPNPNYLRTVEIQNIINKYVDERSLAQIKNELGNPTSQNGGVVTWYREKNGLYIVMNSDSRVGTAQLNELREVSQEQLPRDKRYAQVVSEFDKILSVKHRNINNGARWDLGDDWFFSITKTQDDKSNIYYLRYKFAGP